MLGQIANPAEPGTLNYVEGQVSISGQVVNWSSVGFTALNEGQVIETGNGKAEVLLTPGVFLRLGDNSAVRMISPNLANTEVELVKGRADVEVDQLFKQNDLRVRMKGSEARLLKTGLYAFDFERGTVQVFDGEAEVLPVDGQQKPIAVKDGHELAMNGDGEKPRHFDKEASEDALYNWSSLRSQYLGEANVQLASEYEGVPDFAPGWFWDGGLYGYTWLPGDGAFFNPFGYGFYSPYYLYGGGFVYGYGRGYGRSGYRGAYRQGQTSFHGGRAGGFHGGYGGGFHGGGGFGGGGSHGGGGGHR
jgi:FecR protein